MSINRPHRFIQLSRALDLSYSSFHSKDDQFWVTTFKGHKAFLKVLGRMINCCVCHPVICGNAAGVSSGGACKGKIDCDTWSVGCHLFIWNLFKTLPSRIRIQEFSKNSWKNQLTQATSKDKKVILKAFFFFLSSAYLSKVFVRSFNLKQKS